MTSSVKHTAVVVIALAALAAKGEHATTLEAPEVEARPSPRVVSWPDEHRRPTPAFGEEPVATFGTTLRPRRRAEHGSLAPAAMPTASRALASVPAASPTPGASPFALAYSPPIDIAFPTGSSKSNALSLEQLRSLTMGSVSIPAATAPTGGAIAALGATGGFTQLSNHKAITTPASSGGGDAKGGGGPQSPLDQVHQLYQAATGDSGKIEPAKSGGR